MDMRRRGARMLRPLLIDGVAPRPGTSSPASAWHETGWVRCTRTSRTTATACCACSACPSGRNTARRVSRRCDWDAFDFEEAAPAPAWSSRRCAASMNGIVTRRAPRSPRSRWSRSRRSASAAVAAARIAAQCSRPLGVRVPDSRASSPARRRPHAGGVRRRRDARQLAAPAQHRGDRRHQPRQALGLGRLAQATGRAGLNAVLRGAHVFVQGYRPVRSRSASGPSGGAHQAGHRDGLALGLWRDGPWAGRGFDSLVQTASGFNHAEAQPPGRSNRRRCRCRFSTWLRAGSHARNRVPNRDRPDPPSPRP